MGRKPESNFGKRFVAFLRTLPRTWYEKIQQVGKKGTPDYIICCNGYFVGVELKVGKNEASLIQRLKIENILNAGGLGIILYEEGFEDFKRVMEHIASLPKPSFNPDGE